MSLQKLLVRKKAGQDSRGMYLISSNPSEPEMIELFCRTSKDQKAWMEAIREAIEMCPDEGRVKILSTEAPVIIIISYLN